MTMLWSFRFIFGSGCLSFWPYDTSSAGKEEKKIILGSSLCLPVFLRERMTRFANLGKVIYPGWLPRLFRYWATVRGAIFANHWWAAPIFMTPLCCLCLGCLQMHSDLWLCAFLCVDVQRFFSFLLRCRLFISVIVSFRLDRLCWTAPWSPTNLALIHAVIQLCVWRILSSTCGPSRLSTLLPWKWVFLLLVPQGEPLCELRESD